MKKKLEEFYIVRDASFIDDKDGSLLLFDKVKKGRFNNCRFEPSSKICHKCGHVKENLTLKDRSWKCESCQTLHDRDENASMYILCVGKCPDKDKEIISPCKSGAGAWGAEAGVELDNSLAVNRLITKMAYA